MAPFYVGLVVALGALLVVFANEAWRELSHLMSMSPEEAILMVLSLIDLSLAGNLLGPQTLPVPLPMGTLGVSALTVANPLAIDRSLSTLLATVSGSPWAFVVYLIPVAAARCPLAPAHARALCRRKIRAKSFYPELSHTSSRTTHRLKRS